MLNFNIKELDKQQVSLLSFLPGNTYEIGDSSLSTGTRPQLVGFDRFVVSLARNARTTPGPASITLRQRSGENLQCAGGLRKNGRCEESPSPAVVYGFKQT